MLPDAPLLERRWVCARGCPSAARTVDSKTPMHPCPTLGGLMVPLVPEGERCEQRAVEREDYVGDEMVQTDGTGRPVMSVVTIRDDGQDCTVYAPTARGEKG